jgi:hypothetical protein
VARGGEMKAILMSVRPEWVAKILKGEKTIDIRKTVPKGADKVKKLKEPINIYIYCTKCDYRSGIYNVVYGPRHIIKDNMLGKVVAKFTLKRTYDLGRIAEHWTDKDEFHNGIESMSCLTQKQLIEYAGMKSDGLPSRLHAWFINDLVIFDEPMELGEFGTWCKEYDLDEPDCEQCRYSNAFYGEDGTPDSFNCKCKGLKPINCAPQSWQYIEVEK